MCLGIVQKYPLSTSEASRGLFTPYSQPVYAYQEWWARVAQELNVQGYSRACPRCLTEGGWYEYVIGATGGEQAVVFRCRDCGVQKHILARTLGAPFIPPYGGPARKDEDRFERLMEQVGMRLPARQRSER